jgi:Prokaryotic RING finger family 1
MTPTTQLLRIEPNQRCPLCHEGVQPTPAQLIACAECRTPYHRHCFHELGGCSTLGCTRARRRQRSSRTRRPQRRLRMVDRARVASPCPADWNDMKGNDQVRFCGQCEKNVNNFAGMTTREAEQVLQQTEGKVCGRLYRRADGTVLTADCPVGRLAGLRRRVARVGGLFAAAVALLLGLLGLSESRPGEGGGGGLLPWGGEERVLMGDLCVDPELEQAWRQEELRRQRAERMARLQAGVRQRVDEARDRAREARAQRAWQQDSDLRQIR